MGAMLKELCEVIEARKISDKTMAVVLVFEEDVLWLICGHAPQVWKNLFMSRKMS